MFQITFKNSLIALLGLVAFALFAPTSAYCQEKVLVVNSTSEPVPTVAQGTTKVTGPHQGPTSSEKVAELIKNLISK